MRTLTVCEYRSVAAGTEAEDHLADSAGYIGAAAALCGAEPVAAFCFGFAAGIKLGEALFE